MKQKIIQILQEELDDACKWCNTKSKNIPCSEYCHYHISSKAYDNIADRLINELQGPYTKISLKPLSAEAIQQIKNLQELYNSTHNQTPSYNPHRFRRTGFLQKKGRIINNKNKIIR